MFLRSHYTSSRPDVFCKKGVLTNLAKFTGKHLCQSLFFSCRRPATLLKKRPWHRRFPVNIAKFLTTPFLTEHVWWMLLSLKFWKSKYEEQLYQDQISHGYYSTEAATGVILLEKLLLEILQNPQEITLAQVFSCEFCQISRNAFSSRTPPVAVSVRGRLYERNWFTSRPHHNQTVCSGGLVK